MMNNKPIGLDASRIAARAAYILIALLMTACASTTLKHSWQSPDYKGSARTTQDYIRESIVDPHAYIVPGQTFAAGGRSIMPPFGTVLKPEEIDELVAYLATFK